MAMARKITAKYQSNEALVTREDLDLGFLELLSEGVMVLNRARFVVGTNTAFERLLGWTQAELVGRPCAFFFGCQEPDSRTALCEHLCPFMCLQTLPLEKNTVHYQDLSIAHKDGHRLVVNA